MYRCDSCGEYINPEDVLRSTVETGATSDSGAYMYREVLSIERCPFCMGDELTAVSESEMQRYDMKSFLSVLPEKLPISERISWLNEISEVAGDLSDELRDRMCDLKCEQIQENAEKYK